MKQSSKNLLKIAALLIVALVLFFILSRPAPPDRDQILAQIQTAQDAAQNHDAGGVMAVTSKDFTILGTKRGEIRQHLALFLVHSGPVHVEVSPPSVVVQGDTATTQFHLRVATPDSDTGKVPIDSDVTLHWHRESSRRFLILPTKVWRVDGENGMDMLQNFFGAD